MGFQSSVNSIIGTAAAVTGLNKKMAEAEEAKKLETAANAEKAKETAIKEAAATQDKVASLKNSLYVANNKVAAEEAKINKESNYESFKNSKGRMQYRDKATGRLISKFDFNAHQTALGVAQEQVSLARDIRDSYIERIKSLTGGNN